jgi:hypothetical protein
MKIITLIILMFTLINNPFFFIGNIYGQGLTETGPTQVAEKVYLHTDRDYYNAGDDIWFKSYVIDALTNILSPYTYNLHVELISPDAKIVQTRIVRIENGTGKGDFRLASSLPSGRYTIRSYTNNMRNFDPDFFFNKQVVIINQTDKGNELINNAEYIENKIGISFFPEGGSLVDNIPSVVAFKAVNSLGKGCDVTGEIFSSSGDRVTGFISTHLGMGVFNLKPVPGLNYYAVIKSIDGAELRSEIPKSFSTGVTIHLTVVRNNKLLLAINTNELTLPSIIDHEMKLTISSRNLFTKSTRIKINSTVTSFTIPLEDFPDGILKVTLSGIEGIPLCERLIYFQKNKDLSLNISTDKTQYHSREEVKIKISLSGDTAGVKKAYLSLSAAEINMISDSSLSSTSISSWFLLESDIRGPVERPSYYFDISNKSRFSDLDLLLLTQGWRDFQWKYNLSDSFKHESGFPISGKVRKIMINKPVTGAKINIGIFSEKPPSFLHAEQDSTGHFRTGGVDLTGRAKVIATITGKKNRTEGWVILDSMLYQPAQVDKVISQTRSILTGKYQELKQEAIVKSLIRKRYKLSDTINVGEVIIEGKRKDSEMTSDLNMSRSSYGTPDKELIITPELAKRYTDLFILATKIPGVIYDGSEITIHGNALAIKVDGISADPGFVSSLPIGMIDRIDIITRSTTLSFSGEGEVINIITKRNYSTSKTVFHTAIGDLSGYDAPRLFYSPIYNSRDTTAFMSDTRSTIFWKPDIQAEADKNSTVNYFNADKATTIVINVEGITSEGIPVTGKARYEVKQLR